MIIKLGTKLITKNSKPFFVAEISTNHNSNLNKTLEMIEAAKDAGADAVKFQTYTADTMTIKSNDKQYRVTNKSSPFLGKSLYSLYKKGSLPWEWHNLLKKKAQKEKILFFSSPFDISSVNFLDKLNVPCYKISSFELTHLPLIAAAAKKKRPLIISTGMGTLLEINEAVKTAKKNSCKKIILLKCTSNYPANEEDCNLISIEKLQKKFNCLVGLSDHTTGIASSITSIAYGAILIEKHFKLKNDKSSIDAKFSIDPNNFKLMVKEGINAWKAKGKVFFGPTKSEKKSIRFRRSIFAIKEIKKNEIFTHKNIKILRPAIGLKPKFYFDMIGKKSRANIKKFSPIKFKDFKR